MPTAPPLIGTYTPPAVKIGDRVTCLLRDAVCAVTSVSDAPIPWPRVRALESRGGSGLWVCPELVKAIRTEAAQQVQPLPDWGTPKDVALAAVYLASDASKFMTGATLVLDGGLTIQSPEGLLRPTFRKRWPPGHPLRLDPS